MPRQEKCLFVAIAISRHFLVIKSVGQVIAEGPAVLQRSYMTS